MTTRAVGLAKTLLGRNSPSNIDIFAKDFVSPSDAYGFGFTEPKNIAFANSFFSELNLKEKSLIEERDSLKKQLGNNIPWRFFQNTISDKNTVNDVKELYDSIFESGKRLPALNEYTPGPNQITLDVVPELKEKLAKRASDIEDHLETDINPLLNPFADIWVYEKDGPEFAEIFKARPQWNEIINKSANEFAFTFVKEDPTLNDEIRESFTKEINSKLREFKSNEEQMSLVEKIATGNISDELLEHYNSNYLVPQEDAQFLQITHDDNAALAVRSAWVSPEADPLGKHFGGH